MGGEIPMNHKKKDLGMIYTRFNRKKIFVSKWWRYWSLKIFFSYYVNVIIWKKICYLFSLLSIYNCIFIFIFNLFCRVWSKYVVTTPAQTFQQHWFTKDWHFRRWFVVSHHWFLQQFWRIYSPTKGLLYILFFVTLGLCWNRITITGFLFN